MTIAINVGGQTLDAALARLSEGARVPICGQTSQYDITVNNDPYRVRNLFNLLRKHATITGFSVRNCMEMFDELLIRVAALMKAGIIVYKEDIIYEIDNAPKALIGMMRGENFGNRLIRVSNDPAL